MILETFLAVNGALAATKTATKFVHTKLKKEMSDKIMDQGLYHFTSEENADAIVNSKYIKPSGLFTSFGKRRCYFYAGPPPYEELYSNAHDFLYEYTAVKVEFPKNNQEEIKNSKKKLSKFKQRVLTDDAIVYEGKCELEDKYVSKVHMVLDLDENKKVYLREKTQEEIEKGIYEPSQELRDKLHIEGNMLNRMVNILKIYEYNLQNKKFFSEVISKIKGIFSKTKSEQYNLLPEASGLEVNKEDELESSLKGMVNNIQEIANEKNIAEIENPNINKEEIENIDKDLLL